VSARILVVDNYDSFVYNLVQYLAQLGAECTVLRNDEVDLSEAARFDGILLSPGPGVPQDAGVCVPLVRDLAGQVPIFGVCLGLQAMAVAYGATVSRAPELLHGKTSLVEHGHSLRSRPIVSKIIFYGCLRLVNKWIVSIQFQTIKIIVGKFRFCQNAEFVTRISYPILITLSENSHPFSFLIKTFAVT
jgi:hypothetical protein